MHVFCTIIYFKTLSFQTPYVSCCVFDKYRVATVREKVWKMKFFPGQGKVREFEFESGKIAKSEKVREFQNFLKRDGLWQ